MVHTSKPWHRGDGNWTTSATTAVLQDCFTPCTHYPPCRSPWKGKDCSLNPAEILLASTIQYVAEPCRTYKIAGRHHTATSKTHLSVLSQCNDAGQEHPVAYFSWKLLRWEEHYSQILKMFSYQAQSARFRVYPLGRPLLIQTGHCTLEWLDRLKFNDHKLTCWSLALQP